MDRKQAGLKHGWRSGLEERVAKQLDEAGTKYKYEEVKIPYEVHKHCKYTPDFVLDNGIIIETKGRFVVQDRMKHLLIKEQHPELDIRFVFTNPKAKISKVSKTTYAMWCAKHGFEYAKQIVPEEWLDE